MQHLKFFVKDKAKLHYTGFKNLKIEKICTIPGSKIQNFLHFALHRVSNFRKIFTLHYTGFQFLPGSGFWTFTGFGILGLLCIYGLIQESSESSKWKQAFQWEYDSLMQHGTWELVLRPKGRKVIGSRWLFKVKRDEFGKVQRYKARFIVKGFTQVFGQDYTQTFTLVVRWQSVRTLFYIAVLLGMKCHQVDVKTAFLNEHVTEDIYMKQPEECIKAGDEGKVCKLKRSLYGWKQSPRAWNSVMKHFEHVSCNMFNLLHGIFVAQKMLQMRSYFCNIWHFEYFLKLTQIMKILKFGIFSVFVSIISCFRRQLLLLNLAGHSVLHCLSVLNKMLHSTCSNK